MSWPKSILMVSPNGFRVEYAINPFMRNADGSLQVVDQTKALAQWQRIRDVYQKLGLEVEVIDGDPKFPDMVFCANQCFPFINRAGLASVILSRMTAIQRQGEISHFRNWAQQRDWAVYEITDHTFEGCGDAIWNFETREIYGGHGFRTDVRSYEEVQKITGLTVHRLKLCDPRFYHLDTCLSILRGDVAAYVEEAFDDDGVRLLTKQFKTLIRINKEEALAKFAGNCFSPNGRDVLLHIGADDLKQKLIGFGFSPHEVDTSEFIKAGGSVFCLKQTLV